MATRIAHTRIALTCIALTCIALTCIVLAACGDGPPVEPPPAPASVELLSGDDQRAVQGLVLLDSVAVRVLDAAERPVAGQAVAFTLASGHGTADPASSTTDSQGRAVTAWTLGPDPGAQTLTAAAGDARSTVTATALDLEGELDLLFAPAAQAELDAVRADWAGRTPGPADIEVELSEDISLGETEATLRVVSHVVTGARHYGAIITPTGAEAASLPLLVYLHGGEGGVSTGEVLFAALGLGDLIADFVYVIPSYRSEPLRHGDRVWVSEGTSSHWDYDVDDVISLVDVAFETTPEAKPGAYRVLGASRGGGVALLAGIRDERVERIVTFFGPTDFLDDWVREIVREAALRTPRRLTGVAHLDSTIVQPYIVGDITRPEARLELVRRSPVLFAADIPPLQVHHGTIDFVVSVSQARSLMRAMEALGRGPPDFEAYIYESGGHDFLSLEDAFPRAVAFLSRTLAGGDG